MAYHQFTQPSGRQAVSHYRAILRRDERWPVQPAGCPACDYGLIALGFACTVICIAAQFSGA